VGKRLSLNDVAFDARDEGHHVTAFSLRHVELLKGRREVYVDIASIPYRKYD
jgi:hypothetical protein